ncbi:hypothetical protein KL925_002063 [Ogataea polymorpha]|uniref:uncharacterized protein n=1 Tax=Ogataea polymorpha TaxID=460523 RepID=UPI0007F32E25|nr:uncharacterized protein OGAPODRAFT_8331 [Ogataea polymorpha]KAG7890948.1 hypothetical protein KL936_002232 [Ogataea polymorpha]KAG7894095.1 hypothetical protein KL908_002372 [Ogataea polymorpha]KAG7911084.1 hypothetical protein KL906_001464 [Ogataea polymorpha]KAG7918371.1 hypothetical protein KL927_001828 [Ogataea polymorpha]KAG7927705.1 hypothetical protein KL925_002063 [Ogataea polymorpha]
MSFHPIHGQDPLKVLKQLEGSQLILPVVSIGNTPQLACDLLIHTLPAKLVARLDDIYLYPFASPVDYVNDPKQGITSGLEIYYSEQHRLTILQQRSPILPGLTTKFLKELLIPFVRMAQFGKVVILQSNDAGLREDKNVDHLFLLWANDIAKTFETFKISDNSIGVISERSELDGMGKLIIDALEDQIEETSSLGPEVKGSLKLASTPSASIDAVFLSIFVYEGDNSNDSKQLASQLLRVLHINQPAEWTTPVSWRGVYGNKQILVGMEYGVYT